MIVKLLSPVIMVTLITASVHDRQEKMIDVESSVGSLPSNETHKLFSNLYNFLKTADINETQDNLSGDDYTKGFLPRVVTERPFSNLSNLSNTVAHLTSQTSIKAGINETQDNLSGDDYTKGFLPSVVTERPFSNLSNLSNEVAQLPSQPTIQDRQNQTTDEDYPLDPMYRKLTAQPFLLFPSLSNNLSELPFSLPNVPEHPLRYLPISTNSSQMTESPFPLQPDSSTKTVEPYFIPTLPDYINEDEYIDESEYIYETEIKGESPVLNPTNTSSSSYEGSMMTTEYDNSTMRSVSESMVEDNPDLSYLILQGHTGGYGTNTTIEPVTEYCIWYDNEKEKQFQLQNGTQLSGNGCKSLKCINGVIIPDPMCCKIETHLNGYISTYYLYKNHGEKWIKACELLTCNSGLITKEKRLPGCCVYDHIGSKADGDTWWAYSAGVFDKNFCKVGKCNNGVIELMQVKEGETWRNGCFDHVCKDSDFVMNRVNLPGSCNINHGSCIVNGTIGKMWSKCQGVFCINGNLFKGELQYCSENPSLLYKRYQ